MSRRRRAAVAAVLTAGLLAACAGLPQDPAAAQAPGEALTGRLSLSIAPQADLPAQRFAAGFELQGDAAQGRLRLASPLGTVLGEARWAAGEAVLRQPDGERRFDSLPALSQALLGEPLPLQALVDWLRGRPWPGAPSRPLPSGFEQLEWTVDTQALAEGRIDARRERAPAVELRVRLDKP